MVDRSKKKRQTFSEAELLKGLNRYNSHADELATASSKELRAFEEPVQCEKFAIRPEEQR